MGGDDRYFSDGFARPAQVKTLRSHLRAACERLATWVPDFNSWVVCFCIGIVAWFALPDGAGFAHLGIAVFSLFPIWLMSHRALRFAGLAALVGAGAIGFLRAEWHTAALDTPTLSQQERVFKVVGWVSAVERSGTGERYRIEVTDASDLRWDTPPKRLRIKVTKAPDAPILAGDTIDWLVSAKAPPGRAVPGGYDPARRAWYGGIGGYGFGLGAPRKLEDATLSRQARLHRGWVRWRNGIANRVIAAAPAETAGLQAALLTGVRRHIPPEQTESLRIAGLAHILAISGLHMGLLAGGTYAAATFLLALILPLSRRYDIRKPAAVIGILAATAYLVLSGASVATQRAYIMTIIVFLAVILDRRALSMRSVCVAALVTLMLHPEALLSVGFQMSFAAVAALVATYRAWQAIRPAYSALTLRRRAVNFFSSLSVTSLVAGFATAGFALFHFNRFARYGLFGNLLAMPLFSALVMPLAVASLLAMPFGFEAGPLWLMSQALQPILTASDWVASWPGALDYVPAAAGWVLAVYAIGFVILCLGERWMRLVGLSLILVSFAGWYATPTPDLRISEAGKVAFWSEDASTLMVERKRSDSYGREQFARRAGTPDVPWESYVGTVAQCDQLACRTQIGAWQVSILKHPSEVPVECAASDLVILTERAAGPVARRGCDAVLIDMDDLAREGAMDIYLKDTLTKKAAYPGGRGRRPWE